MAAAWLRYPKSRPSATKPGRFADRHRVLAQLDGEIR